MLHRLFRPHIGLLVAPFLVWPVGYWLIPDPYNFVVRAILAILIWPYLGLFFVAIPFWGSLIGCWVWWRRTRLRRAAILLAWIGSLAMYTAPAVVPVLLPDRSLLIYLNTPDGDFDRDWLLYALADGTRGSVNLDTEAFRCWPSPVIKEQLLRFACNSITMVDGAVDIGALVVYPGDCNGCGVRFRDLRR